MLEELTPEQLFEWRAAIDFIGLDDTWEQAGTVAAAVSNSIGSIAAGFAGESMAEGDMMQAIDFVPLLRDPDAAHKIQPDTQSVAEFERQIQARFSQANSARDR